MTTAQIAIKAENKELVRPTAAAPASARAYYPWLDVLRLLACLLVIVNHVNPYAHADKLGHAGVGLFFSISGFLISSILVSDHAKPGWLSLFYARRFLRIYPPYAAALLLFGALLLTGVANDPTARGGFFFTLPQYLTFTYVLRADPHAPFGIVWSLCVEEYFYLWLPICFLLRDRASVAAVLCGLLLVTSEPALQTLPGADFGTWYLLPQNLIFGALLGLAKPQARRGFPVLGVCGLAVLIGNGVTGLLHPFGPIMGAVCTAVVWSFACTDWTLPGWAYPLRGAGQLSYGIYLLHLPTCSLGLRVARRLGLGLAVPVAYFGSATLIALLVSTAMAMVMYRVVEAPALRCRGPLPRRPLFRYALAAAQVMLVPIGVAYYLARLLW